MRFGAEEIQRHAAVLGFPPDALERLNGAGDIAPEVLTDDPAMQVIIRDHPGLTWKALNVKKRLGVAVDDQEPPA